MTEEMSKNSAGWNLDNSYAGLPGIFYSKQNPTPVRAPSVVKLNERLAAALGLDAEALSSPEGVEILAGNLIPPSAEPLAEAYAGHQFGHFTRLGDGRAILLGEQITPAGERFDIQWKGSGLTPYSRGGDGRAALGPMLREYIISEAMHALGIPTTRSLAVVATGEPVRRETLLKGAILTRVASSHLRVGTFQFAAQMGTVDDVRALADYALQRHYPELASEDERYLALLRGVIRRQASLIAKWQLVGFIHGVMNTDNMAISGETIDYGPCAFMDAYDPATVFSSIDRHGRYAYGNQPSIAIWNLARFAESLLPLLHEDEDQAVKLAEGVLGEFREDYHWNWLTGMRGKLGLFGEEPEDEVLIDDLLVLMKNHKADYTNTFRSLSMRQLDDSEFLQSTSFASWRERWQARRDRQQQTEEEEIALMRRSNPAIIPRNHRVEEALEAAENGDTDVMERLLEVLADPYAYTPQQEAYTALPEAANQPYRTFCGT